MANKHALVPGDIMAMGDYATIRIEQRRKMAELKRRRRVEVGPFVTFYFECYATMWHQVHEMVYIEKGGAEQVAGEIDAYNPLIPDGHELTATFMIEIDDDLRRKQVLGRLGGIEERAFLSFAGETVRATAEADQDRTTAEGKASSVQFVHFPFTPGKIAKFAASGTQIVIGFDHPNYGHMAVMPEAVRAELAKDFD
ncbi:MAG TPA: DUF3501 family protein [Alphaproteobacteria bacterium]|nr:DUF3501 family protein [Alphaproteobacteria bacterium]